MTVKELKEALKEIDENRIVMFEDCECYFSAWNGDIDTGEDCDGKYVLLCIDK